MKVAVVGLGFVGLTLAVKLAEKGLDVLGIESDKSKVRGLLMGTAPFKEPGLNELVTSTISSSKLKVVSSDDREEIRVRGPCDVIIITVGTPVKDGVVDLDALTAAKPLVVDLLGSESVVALRSTVGVGTCRRFESELRQMIPNGKEFLGVCSVPERTAEGVALTELESLPQLIGANDSRAKGKIQDVFSRLANECIALESTEEAEFAKLVSNCYRDFSFSIANLFHYAAEDLGLDSARVLAAVNYRYARANVPKPGPVAGPCLEKDAYIFAASLGACSEDIRDLALSLRRNNELLVPRVVDKVFRFCESHVVKRICVCGIAFKGSPPTDDIRGSLALPVVSSLADFFQVVLHDFEVQGEVCVANQVYEICKDLPEADLYVIMNNHHGYEDFRGVAINAWQ